ncbi:MAG: exodeoxyribonuclease III [Candidatus Ranarchaeia archaeon]
MAQWRLLSWNVNGLRAALRKNFLVWLGQDSPDILALQETKATLDQLPTSIKNLRGYRFILNPAERPGYSGVAFLTRRVPLSTTKGMGIPRFDEEGRVLVAEYPEFLLYNVYFPNGKQSPERLRFKLDFYDAFLEHIEEKRMQGKNIVVCGDFNTAHKEIDLAHPKANEKRSGFLPVERKWIDDLIGHGYVDTFREYHKEARQYSWWDLRTRARERNIGWRIDYFFVNKEFMVNVVDAFILPEVMGSDHCPVGITIKVGD